MVLVALVPLTYEGQDIAPGEVFEVRKPIEAAALTYQRKARFAPQGVLMQTREIVADPAPPDVPDPDVKPKRRYRRRDLIAEDQ